MSPKERRMLNATLIALASGVAIAGGQQAYQNREIFREPALNLIRLGFDYDRRFRNGDLAQTEWKIPGKEKVRDAIVDLLADPDSLWKPVHKRFFSLESGIFEADWRRSALHGLWLQRTEEYPARKRNRDKVATSLVTVVELVGEDKLLVPPEYHPNKLKNC